MAYDQNFGPSRKGAKHGKDMISRIMSNEDTVGVKPMAPLNNSVKHMTGMKGSMNGQKGMDGFSYGVPAKKLGEIQSSEGLSRHTTAHSTEEYKDKKDKAIKSSIAQDGMSRQPYGGNKGDEKRSAKKDYDGMSRQPYGGNKGDIKRSAKKDY